MAGKLRELIVKYRQGIIHFIKFNFVGIVNTGITILVYNLLLAVNLDERIGYPIAYAAGLINSFIMNKLWTFGKKERFSPAEAIKFTIVNLAALGGATLFLHANKTFEWMNPVIAQLLTLLYSIPCNYIGAKYWAFRDKKSGSNG